MHTTTKEGAYVVTTILLVAAIYGIMADVMLHVLNILTGRAHTVGVMVFCLAAIFLIIIVRGVIKSEEEHIPRRAPRLVTTSVFSVIMKIPARVLLLAIAMILSTSAGYIVAIGYGKTEGGLIAGGIIFILLLNSLRKDEARERERG